MSKWWLTATHEQKMAQISGALECGLSTQFTSRILGCSGEAVRRYAANNGLAFPKDFMTGALKMKQKGDRRKAYFGGASSDELRDGYKKEYVVDEADQIRFEE